MSIPKALAVVGATASGKSGLALDMAERLGGEIVCMDSMQVYRGMDVGTAKPTAEERARIPHHMLDVVDPTQRFAVADYAVLAQRAIEDILSRGHVPVLVGGTGLYLKALMHGLSLGGAKSDEGVRRKYQAIAQDGGGRQRLYEMLMEIDPATARKLHPNDVRRVVRAMEVYELTGEPMSQKAQEESNPLFDILPVGLQMPREMLFARIEARVHQMMKCGLANEVRMLLESGVPADAQSMQGIGYKELVPTILGAASQSDAVWQIILNTRHYAKRQGTWFRTEPAVCWLNAGQSDVLDKALDAARAFLR